MFHDDKSSKKPLHCTGFWGRCCTLYNTCNKSWIPKDRHLAITRFFPRDHKISTTTISCFSSYKIILVIMSSLSYNYEVICLILLLQWMQSASVEDKITEKSLLIRTCLTPSPKWAKSSDSRSRKRWCGSTTQLSAKVQRISAGCCVEIKTTSVSPSHWYDTSDVTKQLQERNEANKPAAAAGWCFGRTEQ